MYYFANYTILVEEYINARHNLDTSKIKPTATKQKAKKPTNTAVVADKPATNPEFIERKLELKPEMAPTTTPRKRKRTRKRKTKSDKNKLLGGSVVEKTNLTSKTVEQDSYMLKEDDAVKLR